MKPYLPVHIYGPTRAEIQDWPQEVKKDLGSILTKLQKGELVGHPDTKPVINFAAGVFEIRLKGAGGAYRAFYIIRPMDGILVFHSFKKKTRKTPQSEIGTGRRRLKAFLKEFDE